MKRCLILTNAGLVVQLLAGDGSVLRVQRQQIAFGIDEVRNEADVIRQLHFMQADFSAGGFYACQYRIDRRTGIQIDQRSAAARHIVFSMRNAAAWYAAGIAE